ncbi:MAG: 50S ribosomal protein L28, partial [Deltaproteobacteria bacterium]|nr:50S ribosomal protein L28 [Candidatus Tharpella aukensis]
SHANNKTKKVSRPNLQEVHAVINGQRRKVKACTRCIRSGAITK